MSGWIALGSSAAGLGQWAVRTLAGEGLVFLRRASASWSAALRRYAAHPVMRASLGVILVVPIGLGVVRLAGFTPTTQLRTALETIAANLCWLPPLVSWAGERREYR